MTRKPADPLGGAASPVAEQEGAREGEDEDDDGEHQLELLVLVLVGEPVGTAIVKSMLNMNFLV